MTSLYRVFNDQDRLLYVGIAGDVGRRLYEHSLNQTWWDQVDHWATEDFADRAAAADAELAAITTENPLYNISGKPFIGPKRPSDNNFSIRLEDDLRDALAEDAAANSRTVAGSIRYHLRRSLGMAA